MTVRSRGGSSAPSSVRAPQRVRFDIEHAPEVQTCEVRGVSSAVACSACQPKGAQFSRFQPYSKWASQYSRRSRAASPLMGTLIPRGGSAAPHRDLGIFLPPPPCEPCDIRDELRARACGERARARARERQAPHGGAGRHLPLGLPARPLRGAGLPHRCRLHGACGEAIQERPGACGEPRPTLEPFHRSERGPQPPKALIVFCLLVWILVGFSSCTPPAHWSRYTSMTSKCLAGNRVSLSNHMKELAGFSTEQMHPLGGASPCQGEGEASKVGCLDLLDCLIAFWPRGGAPSIPASSPWTRPYMGAPCATMRPPCRPRPRHVLARSGRGIASAYNEAVQRREGTPRVLSLTACVSTAQPAKNTRNALTRTFLRRLHSVRSETHLTHVPGPLGTLPRTLSFGHASRPPRPRGC